VKNKKDIYVQFVDEKLAQDYHDLKTKDPQLYLFIDRATDDLKKNPTCGIQIIKKGNKDFIKKHKLNEDAPRN